MKSSSNLSPTNLVVLFCGILMLVSFAFLPWYSGAEASASGWQVFSVTQLGLTPDASTLSSVTQLVKQPAVQGNLSMLWLLLAAAIFGTVTAVWALVDPENRSTASLLTFGAGAHGLVYYLLFFISNNLAQNPTLLNSGAINLAGIGFWIALVGALGLTLQVFIPHSADGSSRATTAPARVSAAVPSSIPKSALQAGQAPQTPAEFVSGYWNRLRGGDLGPLPIIVGMIIISVIFTFANENFRNPHNIVNLILQMSPITAIAYGVVYVLLLGEIDLSVGYVSAVAGVSMTILMLPPISFPWYKAIPMGLLVAADIGLLHGLLITTFQVPSFVVTLAGLLGWQGVVLHIIGNGGTVIIQDATVNGIANSYLPPEWGWRAGAVFILLYGISAFSAALTRRRQGLSYTPFPIVGVQIVIFGILIAIAVFICNEDRGVPVIGILLLLMLLILGFVAERTRFGRYIYAVGGNKEAARRAGIRVERIRIYVFMISSFMAGVGGIIAASRLRSVDTNAGGGSLLLYSIASAVIGGTSLFGGRGKVSSAILGALVIAGVDNGMGLLGLTSGDKFIVTGLVLLAAVIIDALARRSQKRAGLV